MNESFKPTIKLYDTNLSKGWEFKVSKNTKLNIMDAEEYLKERRIYNDPIHGFADKDKDYTFETYKPSELMEQYANEIAMNDQNLFRQFLKDKKITELFDKWVEETKPDFHLDNSPFEEF